MSMSASTSAPTVTVLMPAHNAERFVAEAVASILAQSWTDFELVVVDDGSTDRTRAIVDAFADPRIRVVVNAECEGLPRALNRGLAAARGALVARQDADDVAHPHRLATQIAFLDAHPDVALVGAQVRVMDDRGRLTRAPGWWRATSDAGARFQAMFETPCIHTTVVFRRAIVWDELDGYDPRFPTGEDYDLWSRIMTRHAVRNLPETLVDYRYHAGSTSATFGRDLIARSSDTVARNIVAALGGDAVPGDWTRPLGMLHVDPRLHTADDWLTLIPIVEALYARFVERHPGERANPELRRVAADKLGRLACLLAPRHRRAAVDAFGRACRFDRAAAAAYATRFVPLLLAGERARRLRRAAR
jgi:hypothetical protein